MNRDTLIMSQIHGIITQEVNDLVKVRGTRIKYQTEVAMATGDVTISKVLRDILPSKKFKIHGYSLYINNKTAAGELAEMQLLKNISNPPGPTKGAFPSADHGVMEEYAMRATGSILHSVEFAEPLDFDADDELNIFFSWGTQGAGEDTVFEVVLRWSAD